MSRVTAAEVKEIIKTTLTEAEVLPYVTSANIMVTAVLGSSGLSDDVLKEIERWLSAHMLAITRVRQSKSEGAGGASITYTGEYGMNLKSTSYGQMAASLDTTGALSLAGAKQASVKAVTSFTGVPDF